MFAFCAPTVLGLRSSNGISLSVKAAPVRSTTRMCFGVPNPSPSMPFLPKPKNLSEDMIGYAGFDPLALTEAFDAKWMQEAEIKNGRVAMLGCLGMLVQEFIQLPFGPAFSHKLATEAFVSVPKGGLAQIFIFCGIVEFILHKGKVEYRNMHEDPDTVPGMLGFNPLNLPINETSRLQEIKNGRLAMIAAGGMIHSMFIYKQPIVAQLFNFKPFPGL